MGATPNVITNAAVYLDGVNLVGMVDEVTPPTVKDVLGDHKPLGLMSALKLPTGTIEAMDAKYKWGSVYADVLARIADPETAVQLMVRAELKKYGPRGVQGVSPVVMSLHGPITESGIGGFKQGENSKPESTQQVWYYKLEIDGRLIWEIDVFANIRTRGAVDVLTSFRNFVG